MCRKGVKPTRKINVLGVHPVVFKHTSNSLSWSQAIIRHMAQVNVDPLLCAALDTHLKAFAVPRIRVLNRSMTQEDALKAERVLEAARRLLQARRLKARARATAKEALARGHSTGFHNADRRLPQIQIEDNLKAVTHITHWKHIQHEKNAYIMLKGLVDGTSLIPVTCTWISQ